MSDSPIEIVVRIGDQSWQFSGMKSAPWREAFYGQLDPLTQRLLAVVLDEASRSLGGQP